MRNYYRGDNSIYYHFIGGGLTSIVKKLVISNIIVFILQLSFGFKLGFIRLFGLVPSFVFGKLMIWQLVTYMFLHGGIFHLVFNMFALWMFGSDIERIWGSRRFLSYYFFTGIGAGICTYLSAIGSVTPTIGASGAIFGILVAYGMMFPDRIILVSFLFPMKARHFVILFAIVEFLASLSHTPDGIGHFAHLGGMLFGFLYLKNEDIIKSIISKIKFTGKRTDKISKPKLKDEHEDFFEKQINPILDKISRYGIESLNEEERETLRKAKNKTEH